MSHAKRTGGRGAVWSLTMLLAGSVLWPLAPVLASEAPTSYALCAACHGVNGEGNAALQAPALAGLSKDYLLRQMGYFQAGIRGGASDSQSAQQMKQASQAILAQGKVTSAMADYLSSLPVPKVTNTLTGDIKRGNSYYQNNCGACHGGKAQGNPAMQAPRLANQHLDYLRRQFMAFRDGTRGTQAEDKSGRQMAMMAKVLPEDVLEDVLTYIASQ